MLLVLLTRILLWILIGWVIWYILTRFIPRAYLTWLGGFIILALLALVLVESDNEIVGLAWKLLSLPLKPLGLVIILLLGAFRGGWKKPDYSLVTWATGILIVASLPIFAALLAGQLEGSVFEAARSRQQVCDDICIVRLQTTDDPVDAIVVFNEGINHIDTWMKPLAHVNQSPNRLLVMPQVSSLVYASQIYLDRLNIYGNQPLVVVTGGPPENQRSPEEIDGADRIQDFLTQNGVPPDRIQILATGLDVRSTVQDVKRLLGDRGADIGSRPRIIAVAPAIIMRRVGLAFYREGMRVLARPSEYYVYTTPDLRDLGRSEQIAALIPDVEALALTTRATNEYLLSIYYFLRDWLPMFDVDWQGTIDVD